MTILLDSNGLPILLSSGMPVRTQQSQYPTSGLVARWFSDAGVTDSSGAISSWVDQEGSLNFEPLNGGENPTVGTAPSGIASVNVNEEDAMREIGTGSLPTGANPCTLVMCWQPTLGEAAYGGFSYGTGSSGQSRAIIVDPTDTITADWFGTSITGPQIDGSSYVNTFTYDGTTVRLYTGITENNSATATLNTGSTQVNLMCSFSGNTTYGNIYAIFVYDRVLSESERQQVVEFCNQKFLIDTVAPTVSATSPADNATDVSQFNNISLTFSEDVVFDTGTITIRENSGGFSDLYTFDVSSDVGQSAGQVFISDNTLTIYPDATLSTSTEYAIRIGSTCIRDLSSNYFAGISDDTTLNFTTAAGDTTAPSVDTLSPSDNSTGVATSTNPSITFDESVQFGTGNITLRKNDSGWADEETFDVTSDTGSGSGNVSIVGNTLSIAPTNALDNDTEYAIRVDATAIDDLSGNSFSGIADDTTFSFTTASAGAYPLLAWEDVGHSGTLTDYTGNYDITDTTVVLENFRFTSTVKQENSCQSLTIRNCHFDLGNTSYGVWNVYNQSPSNDMTLEDCTFEGTNSSSFLAGGSGTKIITRCRFRDAKTDFVKVFGSGPATFTSCYFGGMSRTVVPPEDFHADTFQNTNSGTVTLRGCTWDAPPAKGGLNVTVTPGSWLESDGVAAGLSVGSIFYKGSIAYFMSGSATGTTYIDECHFKRVPSNGIQHRSSSNPTTYVRNTSWYPSGVYSVRTGASTGTWIDQGGNQWVETGNDLQGNARTAGETITF